VYGDPNFGLLEFDWKRQRLRMSVYRGDGGGVARAAGADDELTLTIDLNTCLPVA